MKTRNREVNIFSMSALDLFASALGAFILLAVIALPYFGNTSVSNEAELKKLQKELSTAKSKIKKLKSKGKAPSGGAGAGSKVKIPDIDVVICLDISGSMSDSITSLKREIVDLADVLNNMAKSLAIGVVVFGDKGFDRPTTVYKLSTLSSSAKLKDLEIFINKLKTNIGKGGGSNHFSGEALYQGMTAAVDMPWRAKSKKKYILVYTDDVAHTDDTSNLFKSVRRFASKKDHIISTTLVGKDAAAKQQLKNIAKQGNGQFIDATSGRSFWASFLIAILK